MRRFGALVLAFGAMLVLSACAGKTTGATNITDSSTTLHATGRCDQGQTCTWYWEYWPADQPRSTSTKTPVQGPVSGPTGKRSLSTSITGLNAGTTYRWVFCASPNNGAVYACAGPRGRFGSTTADPPPDYARFRTAAGWSIQTTPNPTGALGSALSGVSCTSATACTAVGNYDNSANQVVTLAERWDGTTWTIQATPNPTSAHASVLAGVSCTSATACMAVGNYTTNGANAEATLVERWDGTAWTIQPTPTGAQDSFLSGVSCTSVTACTAVGSYTNSSFGQVTLAERWDGTTWTIQTTPSPTGEQSVTLSGVSCRSTTACTAVGDFGNIAGSIMTLAERWDGTTWTEQSTPNSANQSFLQAVSCTSATACTAVGYGQNTIAHTALPLAERWDDTAWTIQTTPSPSSESFLFGLSCTSRTACTAVGGYPTNSTGINETLAERYSR